MLLAMTLFLPREILRSRYIKMQTHHGEVAEVLAHLAASVSRVFAQPGAVRFLSLCGKLAIRLVSITGRQPETGIKKLTPLANLRVPVYSKPKRHRRQKNSL